MDMAILTVAYDQLLYFPILLLMGHSSNVYLRSTSPLGLEKPMQAVTIVHVVCWIAQFIGHGVFEGRAPALLNSLFQCKSFPSNFSPNLIESNVAIVLAV